MAKILTNYVMPVRKAKVQASGKNKEREAFYAELLAGMLANNGVVGFEPDEGDHENTIRLGFVKYARRLGHVVGNVRKLKGQTAVGFVRLDSCEPSERKTRGRKANPNKPVKPTRDPNAPPAKRGRPKKAAA